MREIRLEASVPGTAAGAAIVLTEPLSFWGGLDAATGRIIDVHHPQHGTCITGAVVFLPRGRGSSSASSVFAEAVRLRTAPAAIVMNETDEILVLGSLVANELYGATTPVLVGIEAESAGIFTGEWIEVIGDRILIGSPPGGRATE